MICRVCDSPNLELAIDLGHQPWCNHFLKREEVGTEPFYPLRVAFCHSCATAQLDYTVPKEVMFGDHTYLSGVTRSLSDHFQSVAEKVDGRFLKDTRHKLVLDIGSNDGTQLRHFKALGYEILGVEPSKTTAKIATEAGIPTVNEFFDLNLARRLGTKFHVINAAGVFFHLEDLHSVTEAIRECLREDGVFVVQFLYMKRILENVAFDQIYHEHLLYYNLQTIEVLLNRHGLSMFDAYVVPIHGGSVVGFVTHAGKRTPSRELLAARWREHDSQVNTLEAYLEFRRRVSRMKDENVAYLEDARRAGKSVYGFGAPAKGNTLLNYFKIGTNHLTCLVEKNRLRDGLFSPGMHIPIIMEDAVQTRPDIYYVLAWNFKKEILANNMALIERGTTFYFPVDPGEV